jgi:hypothetical protein
MQQLSTTGLSTSNLMKIATEKGLDVGALVNNKAAAYTIQSSDEDDGVVAFTLKGRQVVEEHRVLARPCRQCQGR